MPNGITGTGTANTLAKWTGANSLSDSRITDDGSTSISINSGAGGSLLAGDIFSSGNGVLFFLNDNLNLASLQVDTNNNSVGLELAGQTKRARLHADGVVSLALDGANDEIEVMAGAINPTSNGVTGLGSTTLRFKRLFLDAETMPPGTTGDATIHRNAGSVNFGPGASFLTVTCNRCSADSVVLAVVATDDLTAQIKSVVPANGAFTITLVSPATAETKVNFLVLN